MSVTYPSITLNNGVELPALGFCVFQTPADVTQAAVEEALRVRHGMVDTAASYLNERAVGAATAAGGVERSELFVPTTKGTVAWHNTWAPAVLTTVVPRIHA